MARYWACGNGTSDRSYLSPQMERKRRRRFDTGLAPPCFAARLRCVGVDSRNRMLLRLTRRFRVQAGWLVALAYLVCVVSPAAALALGSGPVPCFLDDAVSFVSAHDDQAPAMHMHADGRMHDHAAMHAHDHADGGAPAGHHHDGRGLPGPCCAMLCIVAIPADLPDIAAPAQPVASRIVEADLSITGRAPPL